MFDASIFDRTGFVYLIGSGGGLFKIGISRAKVRSRLMAIRTERNCKPELRAMIGGGPLTIIHLFHTKSCLRAERALHHHFKDKRLFREWFSLNLTDVILIKSIGVEKSPPISWLPCDVRAVEKTRLAVLNQPPTRKNRNSKRFLHGVDLLS